MQPGNLYIFYLLQQLHKYVCLYPLDLGKNNWFKVQLEVVVYIIILFLYIFGIIDQTVLHFRI